MNFAFLNSPLVFVEKMRFFNFVAISGIVFFSGCEDTSKNGSKKGPSGDSLLSPEPLVDEEQFPIGNRGQVNLGNTCYFNALMQVLAHADPVKEYVEKTEVAQDKPVTSGFKNLVMAHWNKDHGGEVYNPKKFLELCRRKKPESFGEGRQEDAYEAYGEVLNMLEDANLKGLYNFQVASRLHCPNHGIDGEPTVVIESALTLPVPEKQTRVDVTELLRSWGALESLEANCGQQTNDPGASRSFMIMTAPDVLVLHLGRFAYNKATGVLLKIKEGVTFDIELDLGNIMNDRINPTLASQGSLNYKLTGVVHHHGEDLGNGHYTADYHNSFYNRWFHADDRQISKRGVPGKKISTSAYLLIYSKVK